MRAINFAARLLAVLLAFGATVAVADDDANKAEPPPAA
jgi:hypothetical protein